MVVVVVRGGGREGGGCHKILQEIILKALKDIG
jgi:hypothetical protein